MDLPEAKRILLANELGGGWGHVWPWFATLEQLAHGHHWVSMAVYAQPQEMDGAPDGIAVLQAPPPPSAKGQSDHGVYSWPQLLVQHGYADPHKTQPALQAWMALLQRHGVDHLIVDHAPLALMAAKILGIAVTEAGSGFVIPPASEPMPAFLPVRAQAVTQLRHAEDRLRANWLRLAQRTPASLLEGHARRVCSIAALDPYGPRTGVDYLGPLPVSCQKRSPSAGDCWWHAHRGEILAYLKVHTPGLKEIMHALGRCGRKVLAVVPGLKTERIQGNLRVTSAAVDLPACLETARLLVTNGGIHSTGLGLAARIPLMLVPMHAEQWLTAQRLVQHGWGTFWHPRLRSNTDLIRVLQAA